MGLQCVFAGPDDEETCDSPNGGCDGAVNGGPYDPDSAPEPGEFDCGSNCRHIIQLIGDDEADDGETFTYVGSVGFVPGPARLSNDLPDDEDQRRENERVANEDESRRSDEAPDKTHDEQGHRVLQDTFITRLQKQDVDDSGKLQARGPDDDIADRGADLLAAVGDVVPVIEDWADIVGSDAESLAAWSFDTGIDPQMIVTSLALDNNETADLLNAYNGLLGAGLNRDYALKLLGEGNVEQLSALAKQSPEFTALLQRMSAEGFSDRQASFAYQIAEAIGGRPTLGSDGLWTVSFREASSRGSTANTNAAVSSSLRLLAYCGNSTHQLEARARNIADQLGLEHFIESQLGELVIEVHGRSSALDVFSNYMRYGNSDSLTRIIEGGRGSGNFSHAGRPGQIGGSASGGGAKRIPLKQVEDAFMNAWITTSTNAPSHYLQMVMNEAYGRDRYDNLIIPGYRSKEKLEAEYREQSKKVSPEQAREYCQRQCKLIENRWNTLYPNGQTLYRGIAQIEADALDKQPIGSRVQFRPLMSSTDVPEATNTYGTVNVEFKGVRGSDVFESYRTEPQTGWMHKQSYFETIVRGNTRDWIIADKNANVGGRKTFVLTPAPMKEADSKDSVLVLHSNMDFGTGKIVDDYASIKNELREGGTGSGDHDHAGRPGEVGGSSSTGGKKAKPGTHVLKVSEEPGIHTIDFPNSNDYLNYRGFPTDTRIKNQILSEIDKNIDVIPGQVKNVDEVFLTDQMEVQEKNTVRSLPSTVGVTLSGLAPNATVIGFNSKNIALHDLHNEGYAVADQATSTSAYARMIVDHEMGHVRYNQLGAAAKIEWQVAWRDEQNDTKAPAFSRYSAGSPTEGFAEAYSAYINKTTMPVRYSAYMEDLLDGRTLREVETNSDDPIAYLCGFGEGPTHHIYRDHVETFSPPMKEKK